MAGLGESLQFPAGQQIRGKKKVAKATTIKVKLLRNIAGFGKKGSIVPVPPGTMRNTWFPNKMAEYMTLAKLKELGDVVVERDPTFGSRQEKELAKAKKEAEKERARKTQEMASLPIELATPIEPLTPVEHASSIEPAAPLEPPAPIEPEELSPQQAAAILERLLPATIEFHRTPIPAAPARKLSPSLAATSNLSAAAAAASAENAKRNPQKPTKISIIGSVSTADIAANLKAILWEDKEGARVVLSPEDISFVKETEDQDRVKHLGTFGINITLGPSETVRTTIEIKAQN